VVPVWLVAVGGEVLGKNAINNPAGLSRHVPNLIIGDALITTAVSIGGMGSQPERGFEQSVGMFIDGIYMPRSRQYRAPFFDIERVEVMRGPQAVLFGLNSTAGAVSIITRRTNPGDAPLVDLTGEYEFAQGGYRVSALLGGSPTDTLGLRLAVRASHMDDFFLNDYSGKQENGSDETIVRFSGVWEPTENIRFDFNYERGSYDMDGNLGEQWGPDSLNQLLLLGLDGGDDGKLNWRHNMDASFMPLLTSVYGGRKSAGFSQDYDHFMLSADFDIGVNTLTAILGSSDADWNLYTDGDASMLAILDAGFNEQFEQDSLELRWTSPLGSRFDYIFGFYMHDNELGNQQPNIVEPTFSTAPGAYGFDQIFTSSGFKRTSNLWSLFLTGTLHIADNWRLTAGVRYADEDKEYRREAHCLPVRDGVIDFNPSLSDQAVIKIHADEFFCANQDGYSDNRNADNWMPEVALEWDMSADIMWYGKYSQSAKSGGWAASTILAPGLIAYDDERSESWELGMRSYLANNKGALNLALFNTRFDDLQVNAFDPLTFSAGVGNAAEVSSKGVELDGSWRINDWLTMRGAYAYLDTNYDSYRNSPCPVSETLAGTLPPCDASGKPLPLAPKHSLTLGFDVNKPLSSGMTLLAGLNIAYTDDYHTDAALEPELIQSSFTNLGARIGVESTNGKWNVSLVGTNLTNQAILNNSLPFFNSIGFIQPPRQIWLQVTWRFKPNEID